MKETELEALNHQLQGIMDCSDAMNLFCLMKMNRLYGQQRNRLNKIMSMFHQTSCLFITKYQEIPKVSTTFQREFVNATPKNTELIVTFMDSWVEWETKGVDLYQRLLGQTTILRERQLWRKMLTTSKMCLQTAQQIAKHYKQQYMPQNTNANKPTTTATTDIRQRMQEKLATTQK